MRVKNVNRLSYHERVSYGKAVEEKILHALRGCGYRIFPSSLHNDIHDKIDGYILLPDAAQPLPLQVKYRSTGPDILMEVTFLDKGIILFDGRDFKGKAKVYACLGNDHQTIHLCMVDELKARAVELTNRLLLLSSDTVSREEGYGEVRRVVDARSGRSKVILFVRPSDLRSHWQVTLPHRIFHRL